MDSQPLPTTLAPRAPAKVRKRGHGLLGSGGHTFSSSDSEWYVDDDLSEGQDSETDNNDTDDESSLYGDLHSDEEEVERRGPRDGSILGNELNSEDMQGI